MRQPRLRPDPSDEFYVVTADYAVDVDGVQVVVPRQFSYDGASIPSVAWQITFTPFNPRVMAASVVHDWLYYNHQVDRETADNIFHTMLERNRVGSATRNAMWAAVHTFGGAYWENDADDLAFLRRLREKVRNSPNFERYRFPA